MLISVMTHTVLECTKELQPAHPLDNHINPGLPVTEIAAELLKFAFVVWGPPARQQKFGEFLIMQRRTLLLVLSGLPLLARADGLGSLASALKDPLIALLTSQLNVNDDQAKGGMGSLLTLLKEKLSLNDFGKITKLVPNASKYMSLAKSLGAVTGPVKNKAGLNGALGKLGMDADTSAKFVPTITDYLGKLGGDTTKTLLAKALQ